MSESDEYEVGYRKPPQKTQFKKGKSGNPMGRKKGTKSIGEEFLEELERMVIVSENRNKKTVSRQRAMSYPS